MTYGDRIEVVNGVPTSIAVDNTWILANRENYLEISGPGSASAGAGFTATAQLKTPLLVNDTRDDVLQAINIPVIITLATQTKEVIIALDSNGAFSDTVTPAHVGTLTIRAKDMPSNVYTVEVT